MTPDKRGQLLWRIAELLERDAEEIAALETLDQGQPAFVSAGINLPLAAQVFRYYAGFATKIEGKVSPISITAETPTRTSPHGAGTTKTARMTAMTKIMSRVERPPAFSGSWELHWIR